MRIKINNTHLFFDVYGSKLKVLADKVVGKPTLVVLYGGHGFGDHSLYVEFWSQFSDQVQVIFLDQRGCGRSDDAPLEECNLKNWGADLYTFCETLDLEKPIIAGISMGGHVMCEYIKHHPKHPAGLIFCNTEARFMLDDICAVFEKRGGKEVAEIARGQFTHPTPEITAAYYKKCVPYYAYNAYTPTELGRCIKHHGVFEHFSKHEATKFNYLEEMNKIQCPTLFMVGEDSPMHPPIRATEMAERIEPKWVTLEIFEKAGAAVYKDKPEEAYQVVKQFLEKF